MLKAAYLAVSTVLVTGSALFGGDVMPWQAKAAASLSVPVATVSAVSTRSAVVRTKRADDGLFYLTLGVNDTPVRFVVDTGASVVVLTQADAHRAGVSPHTSSTARIATAAGGHPMRWATADRLTLNDVPYHDIDVAVVGGGARTSLLGQDFLSKFASLTISGDELTLSTAESTAGGDRAPVAANERADDKETG